MNLVEARARFARLIAAAPGVDDARVAEAFASVPRERFVGPGPWMILGHGGYVRSESADPALLYDDVVVALLPDKRINNGQPTLHARCLSAARIRAGERVLHVGCGSGYYTAVLSELATGSGEVEAWDVEPRLVASAATNLEGRPAVRVGLRDATSGPVSPRDVIYVCAGCTRPVRTWVEALAEGGRLIFPLTPGWDYGAMLMITRQDGAFHASFICRCSFIPCVGGSSSVDEPSLREAFAIRGTGSIASLHFGDAPVPADTWLAGDGWWLSAATTPSVH